MQTKFTAALESQEKMASKLQLQVQQQQEEQTQQTKDSIDRIEKKMNVENERVEQCRKEEHEARVNDRARAKKTTEELSDAQKQMKVSLGQHVEQSATALSALKKNNTEEMENVEKKMTHLIHNTLNESMLSMTQTHQKKTEALKEEMAGLHESLRKRVEICDHLLTDLNHKHTKVEKHIQEVVSDKFALIDTRFSAVETSTLAFQKRIDEELSTTSAATRATMEEQFKTVQLAGSKTREQSTRALQELTSKMTAKQEDSIQMLTEALEDYSTAKDTKALNAKSLLQVEDLRAFVRKELSDHSEGMAMTHTKVEELESKMTSTHESSISTMQHELTLLKEGQEAHTKANATLQHAIKNSFKKNKVTMEERFVQLETNVDTATQERISTQSKTEKDMTTMNQQRSQLTEQLVALAASQHDTKEQWTTQAAQHASMATDLKTTLDREISQLKHIMETSNSDTDAHLKTFRTKLTEEIAQALSQCNTRLAAAEKATKEMTESSDSATQENLALMETNIQAQMVEMRGALQHVVEENGTEGKVTMEQVGEACRTLRKELIRRDELLESQLVDAHAQMTRETQMIVAPAKSQVENMRQQVSD